MGSWLKKSTAVTVKLGPFLDSTDGDTEETALTISQADILLSKNGGAFAQSNNAAGATHDTKGLYGVPLDTTDTNTLGELRVYIHESGALAVWETFMVVSANVWDSFFSTDKLQVDITQLSGVAQSLIDLKDFADAGYDPATNKVQGVVLVDTVTDVTNNIEITQASADKVWSTAARTLTSFGTLIQDIWDKATSALTTAGSIGKLFVDNINTTISSRSSHAAADIWAVGTRTLTSFGTLVSDIWANATRTLTGFSTSLAVSVWDVLETAILTASSIGLKVKNNLNATITSRQPSGSVDLNADQSGITVGTVNALGAQAKLDVNAEADTALSDIDLDHLIQITAGAEEPTDGSYLDQIMHKDASQTFDATTDSLEAIRDRGDAAWTTGGGGSITDILNIVPLISRSIDLANTATVRLGFMLTNAVDDLPSTAEISPGTISIDRKAIGDTTWTNVVNAAVCLESAGLIYYDEVFDSGSGYAEGDTIRITFKSQKITVAANDYEITDATGRMFYTEVRQTMRGTNNAALASVCTEARLAELDAANLPSDIDAILTDTNELQGDWANGGRLDLLLDAILADVTGINGDAMRGTDNAALASALTTHDGKLVTVDGIVDAIKAVTDLFSFTGNDVKCTLDGETVTVSDKTGFSLSAAGIDAVHDEEIDNDGTAISLRQALKLILAVTTAKSSGGGTTTLIFRDIADTKNRLVVTVDDNGNRTAVGTRDAS